jgi:hypothetical protein
MKIHRYRKTVYRSFKGRIIWKDSEGYFIDGWPFEGVNGLRFSSLRKVRVAIRLWITFCMNVFKLNRYLNMLTVDPSNYSGCYGKFISIEKLEKLVKR